KPPANLSPLPAAPILLSDEQRWTRARHEFCKGNDGTRGSMNADWGPRMTDLSSNDLAETISENARGRRGRAFGGRVHLVWLREAGAAELFASSFDLLSRAFRGALEHATDRRRWHGRARRSSQFCPLFPPARFVKMFSWRVLFPRGFIFP